MKSTLRFIHAAISCLLLSAAAQAIYQLTLRWKLTGDPIYADRSVTIANAWSGTLLGVTGDTNQALAAGICGY